MSNTGLLDLGDAWAASRIVTFTSDTNARMSIAYDLLDRVITQTYASEVVRVRTYDAAGQVTRIVETSPSAILLSNWTFTYDPVGNRSTVIDKYGGLSTYTMDAKNRLTEDNTSSPWFHNYPYTYDATDNRLTSSETGARVTWTYDPASRMKTAITDAALTTYGYSLNGNLTLVNDPTNTGVTSMSYDKENRLSVYWNETTVATYTYSGDGLKRRELVNGASTTIVWDGTNYLEGRS